MQKSYLFIHNYIIVPRPNSPMLHLGIIVYVKKRLDILQGKIALKNVICHTFFFIAVIF